MKWKDGQSRSIVAVFAVLRTSFRVRRALRNLRNIGGTTVAAMVLLVFGLAFRNWILFGSFLLMLAITALQRLYFHYFILRSRLDDVDEMTGWEFERWLERFFEQLGFAVERTPYRGDFGADFVLKWNGTRIAVQAKRTSQLVGLRAVQEVVAAKAYYECDQAMVVTNSYYTEQALILARANNVRMRSRDDLAEKAAGFRNLGEEIGPFSSARAVA
jgi:HJR/Mrr/RecB family endonuclease